MIYLYTDKPDDTCHEINGVYGRPVHSYEKESLLKKGWVKNASQLSKAKSEKAEETKTQAELRKELAREFNIPVADSEGKPLHYRLIDSAIKEAQANEHNEG